jgi:ribosomal protein L5
MTFKERYKKEILPNLKKELKIKNEMELPKIEKIVLNM